MSFASARRRSQYYFDAKEEYEKVTDNIFSSVDAYDFSILLNYFSLWCWNYLKGKRGVLLKENKYLFVKLQNRFMESYRQHLREKFAWLNFVDFKLSLSLTIDPKKFSYLKDEFDFCSVAWNRLNSAIKRKYGKFFYLRVLEVQKSGRPHLHLLIANIPYIDVVWLRELWATKYGGGVQIRIDQVHASGLSYLLKYVAKTLVSLENASDQLYSALLFASNKRCFSMNDVRSGSPLCLNITNEQVKHSEKYVWHGSVPETSLAAFCREHDVPLDDFVVLSPSEEVKWQWRELFGDYTEALC